MRILSFILLLCMLQSLAFGQIVFEEVVPPKDFSIDVVRKSPVGEYFVQAQNDHGSIYTSMDALVWDKQTLPTNREMDEMEFFSDGTPILKRRGAPSMIRRDGVWQEMQIIQSGSQVEASVIVNDTLFAYQEESFAYSVDKGATFVIMFSVQESIVDHSAKLWKLPNHFVLQHTSGAIDMWSVYNMDGERVLFEQLGITNPRRAFHACGALLVLAYDKYYRLDEQSLELENYDLASIMPADYTNEDVFFVNGKFFTRINSVLYKSEGCDFQWDTVLTDPLLASLQSFWMNAEEEIFLYQKSLNTYYERQPGESDWSPRKVNIDFAHVLQVDETVDGHKFVRTPNFLFDMVSGEEWAAMDTSGIGVYDVQHSPDGDMYANRGDHILHSSDHGKTFSRIEAPFGVLLGQYDMHILGNDVIFIHGNFGLNVCYTLNNGADWIVVEDLGFRQVSMVELVSCRINICTYK